MFFMKLLLYWLKCPFQHPKNLKKVYLNQNKEMDRHIIQPFDILLFHGHSFPVNLGIQIATESDVNHAAQYIGAKRKSGTITHHIFHAVGEGLLIQSLQEAWSNTDKYILVYRYKRPLTFVERDRLTETFNKYYLHNGGYAFLTLGLLFFATLLKGKKYLADADIDDVFQAINDIFESKKEPMIDCSELIYRGWTESGLPLQLAMEGLRELYFDSERELVKEFMALKSKQHVHADFVTPADLKNCLDLELVGELVKEF